MKYDKIGIVDYDCGNIQSVINAIEYLDCEYSLITNENDLNSVNKLILPGVGAYDHAIHGLKERGLFFSLKEWVEDERNMLLGICLGMQVLCTSSEESLDNIKGLDIIKGKSLSLKEVTNEKIKVPHMGWNTVEINKNPIFVNVPNESDFYFVHSYGVFVDSDVECLGKTNYGGIEFCSMISNNKNVYGVQFHPEKSHIIGLDLLRDFISNA